jgi:hypothetical protein
MNSFDPTICFDAREIPPPENRQILAFDAEQMGWWLGQYFPDAEDPSYQPSAWHLAGL